MDFKGHQTQQSETNFARRDWQVTKILETNCWYWSWLVRSIIRWRFRVISWFITFYNPIWIEEYISIIHYKYKSIIHYFILYSYVQLANELGPHPAMSPIRDSWHRCSAEAKLVSCGPAPSFSQLGADQFGSWKSISGWVKSYKNYWGLMHWLAMENKFS